MKAKNSQVSYGIILYTKVNGEYQFLCGKRRDTIPYIDFLLVKYDIKNLKKYFSLMTEQEKYRLLNFTFDEIWNNLWASHNCIGYTSKYLKSKQHFEQFKESGRLAQLIQESKSVSHPSWEFPKGKKQTNNEPETQCALREFTEETTIDPNRIVLLNFKPQVNISIGSNGKKYTTIYYIAFVSEPIYISPKTKCKLYDKTVSDEFSELKWITLFEARQYLEPNKVKILENVVQCLNVPHLSKKSLDKLKSMIECIKTENN